jgi:hypothetical protein
MAYALSGPEDANPVSDPGRSLKSCCCLTSKTARSHLFAESPSIQEGRPSGGTAPEEEVHYTLDHFLEKASGDAVGITHSWRQLSSDAGTP